MINKQEKLTKVKLKGNESFNIREGWLRKGMRCVQEYPTLFSRDDAMEILGVGSKMVKSIRYWLRATGLTEESTLVGRAREQRLTDNFGDIVNYHDPYFDDVFTLFLLHYNIVKDSEGLSVVWNIFFNNYNGQDFTKENMVEKCKEELNKRLAEEVAFSDSLFADECASILRMYNATDVVEDPEESLGCPMVELGLIRKSANNKGTYVKTPPARELLDKLAVFYVILDNMGDKDSVSFDSLINDPNNVGKVFNLDRVLINEYLDQLRASGYITLNRTAGLDMVYVNTERTPQGIMREYYEKRMK
jgi:hypothetical protein